MPESALEIFRDACGLRAPLTLECQDTSRTMAGAVTYQLDCPFAFIGRDPQFDLVFHNADVSRRHAFLQVIDGRVFCIDLDSRTRLRWDSATEPQTRGWLIPGSTLQVGPYAIRRVGDELPGCRDQEIPDPLANWVTDPAETPSLPGAGLDLPIRIGDGGQLWRMEGRFALIGRSESCQVMLRDPSVSRFHAAVVRTPKGVWIVDLQAREGVLINGVRVKWAWLEDGDTVRIGQFTSILRYESLPENISRSDVPLEAGATPSAAAATPPSGVVGTSLALRSAPPAPAPARIDKTAAAVAKRSPALTPDLLVADEPGALMPASQVAMMQQQMQMMENFHRDMILMVQMFMAMHREHRVAIRDELDRVEKLTKKLNVLQKKLGQAGTGQGRSPDVEKPARNAAKADHAGRNGAARSQGSRQSKTARNDSNAPAQPSVPPRQPEAGGPTATSKEQTGKSAQSPPPAMGPAELHSQLTQRIAELQRERQNYWQRILSAINK